MILTNTTIKIPKKFHFMIEEIDNEGHMSGYWAYSKPGFQFLEMGGQCHTAHEYNQKDLMKVIRSLAPCDCDHCRAALQGI